jgi:hypothetical protein
MLIKLVGTIMVNITLAESIDIHVLHIYVTPVRLFAAIAKKTDCFALSSIKYSPRVVKCATLLNHLLD